MSLTIEFIHHADIAKAGHEALVNVERLRLAGHFREAFEVCSALTRSGPWACPKAGQNFQRATQLMPLLAWLNGAMCPQVGDEPRRSPAELSRWARAEQRESFGMLVIADRLQREPAGSGWTRDMLETLPDSIENGAPSRAVGGFLNDLDWVLKDRVRRLLSVDAPELVPGLVAAMTPFRSSAGIRVSPDAEAFDHCYLMDVLYRCLVQMGGGGYLGDRCLMLSVALDLAVGNQAAATVRLQQWSRWLVSDAAIDHPLRCWGPYVEVLRSGVLASALDIDEVEVQEYLGRFRARGPDTVLPVSSASEFDWHAAIEKFRANLQVELSDPEQAENAVGMLQFHTPVSSGLIKTAKKLECTRPGLSDNELAALEARLGLRLPASYCGFLSRSNGLFCGNGMSLLPAEDIDWFRNLDPDSVEVWARDDDDEATDEQYATYGPDQDCIHMRPRYLRTALQVSTSIDCDVLLLIPDVRFGDEWEAWFFGAKNPGAFRYRSFAEMIEETIFKWART